MIHRCKNAIPETIMNNSHAGNSVQEAKTKTKLEAQKTQECDVMPKFG